MLPDPSSFGGFALIINLILILVIITLIDLSIKALQKYLRSDDKASVIVDIDTAVKTSLENGVFLEYIKNHKEEIRSLLAMDTASEDTQDDQP